MNSPPRVSMGLPVYNGGHLLPDALASLLGQDFDDFELIVSDNGSTDGTEEVCRDWAAQDARIRYVRHDRNRGASFNHNFCVHEARGELFKWCSDDDLLRPTFLGRCVEALAEDPGAVLAYTRACDIDEEGILVRRRGDHITGVTGPRPSDRFRRVLRELRPCFPIFGVVRTSVLRRTGLLGAYTSADRVLLAELALHGPWREVPDHLFLHREHPRRSTYTHADRRVRAAWFDPANRSRRVLPTWRLLSGYRRAVRRAALPPVERLWCEAETARWVFRMRRGLVRDALLVVGPRRLTAGGVFPTWPGGTRHTHSS